MKVASLNVNVGTRATDSVSAMCIIIVDIWTLAGYTSNRGYFDDENTCTGVSTPSFFYTQHRNYNSRTTMIMKLYCQLRSFVVNYDRQLVLGNVNYDLQARQLQSTTSIFTRAQ